MIFRYWSFYVWGFRPNTKLIEGKVETLPNGAIKVIEYMQTSDPDIFAAGDSAVVNYNPSGSQNYIPLATNARAPRLACRK